MSLKKKSAEGLKWSFIETIGVRLFSVSTYFILAKLLDPTAFGIVALTNTFIFFSEIFVEQGFVTAIVQRKNLEKQHLSSAFWGNLAMGIALFGLSVLGAPWIASIYDEGLLTDLLRVHAATFVISSFAKVQLALLQRDLKLKEIAIARTVAITISCVVSITLAYQGYGAWSLIFQQIIFNLLQTLMFWFLNDWRPTAEFSPRHYREIFSFGSKVIMGRITLYFIRYTDTLLIGYFLGTNSLGIYSFAQKIFITLTDLVDLTFNKVTFAVFSKLQDERKKLASNFYKFIDVTAAVSFPLFTATIVFTPHIVPIFFGDKWLGSIPIIQILSLAGVAACLYSCFNNLFSGIGRVGLNLRIKLGYLSVTAVLMYLAVQVSTEMVAFAYLISLLLTIFGMLYYVRQFIGLNVRSFFLSLVQPFLASIIIAALVYGSSFLVNEVSLLILALQIIGSLMLYAAFVALVKPNLIEEFKLPFKKKLV